MRRTPSEAVAIVKAKRMAKIRAVAEKPCPTCGAKVGQRCYTPSGREVAPSVHVHVARLR